MTIYVLEETSAPNGYIKAEKLYFIIDLGGSVFTSATDDNLHFLYECNYSTSIYGSKNIIDFKVLCWMVPAEDFSCLKKINILYLNNCKPVDENDIHCILT